MGVYISQKNALTLTRKTNSQIDRRYGFAYAALLVAEGRDFCSVFHVRFLHKISGVSFFAFSTLFYWILTVAHCFFPLFRQISLYQFDLSSDDERTGESVSIENQKIMLSRYVQEQGWNLYAAYCDDGVSGTTFDRPMFNQMIADAKAGKINLILCKDLSRLGRDYIEAGRFTDIVFPSMGCRFIALNDGVDTIHKNNEMLVILKNVMNDLYARDTSSKIRAVKQSTFKSGKYVGCYAPIGYRKSPADKHILEIDPVTAPVVLRIFDMRLQGDSFRKIARTLNEEGVPSPRGFYYMAEGRPNLRGETPYWNDVTVKTILRNEVYLGHMVQNKTGTVSYKVHKQVSKPKEDWIKVEHTHEPLVSQEAWDAVQRLDNHPSKGRSGSDGVISLFAGVLYCADCGGSMRDRKSVV